MCIGNDRGIYTFFEKVYLTKPSQCMHRLLWLVTEITAFVPGTGNVIQPFSAARTTSLITLWVPAKTNIASPLFPLYPALCCWPDTLR